MQRVHKLQSAVSTVCIYRSRHIVHVAVYYPVILQWQCLQGCKIPKGWLLARATHAHKFDMRWRELWCDAVKNKLLMLMVDAILADSVPFQTPRQIQDRSWCRFRHPKVSISSSLLIRPLGSAIIHVKFMRQQFAKSQTVSTYCPSFSVIVRCIIRIPVYRMVVSWVVFLLPRLETVRYTTMWSSASSTQPLPKSQAGMPLCWYRVVCILEMLGLGETASISTMSDQECCMSPSRLDLQFGFLTLGFQYSYSIQINTNPGQCPRHQRVRVRIRYKGSRSPAFFYSNSQILDECWMTF